MLKRAASTGPRRLDRPTTAPEHVDLGASSVSFSSSGETTGRRKNVDALVEKFKRRVEEAEDQLQSVKEDNKELRSKLQKAGAAVSREQRERRSVRRWPTKTADLPTTTRNCGKPRPKRSCSRCAINN